VTCLNKANLQNALSAKELLTQNLFLEKKVHNYYLSLFRIVCLISLTFLDSFDQALQFEVGHLGVVTMKIQDAVSHMDEEVWKRFIFLLATGQCIP
jgi:hypothetical protein